ncbi:L-fucose:H+ symporter permease [Lactobacillus sp. PSON]|uniref:L-fucose:H+ symporter permease n=1 Tax=Lactobacillus sp. PSON TaxID=3455454 RepID=UPI00404167A5
MDNPNNLNTSTVKNSTKKLPWVQYSDGYLNKTPVWQYILVSLIFPMWGMAASLNDILITQFKTVFSLSDTATAFVQFAFYGGYFLLAIPAATIIRKNTYKFAILTGLTFFIIGCGMFFPASHMATYGMFLVAVFIIAIGLSFLETSCDTYSTMMGPKSSSNLRINLSQMLIPFGDAGGILLGKYLVFAGHGNMADEVKGLSSVQKLAYNKEVLQLTLQPYKYILIVLIILFALIAVTKMPLSKATPSTSKNGKEPSTKESISYLLHNGRFMKSVGAQFLYAGMQTCVWSFTIRFALRIIPGISDHEATNYMVIGYMVWFAGKILATWLMHKFSITKVMVWYGLLGTAALIFTIVYHHPAAIWGAVATDFFFGPFWPTIYAHGLDQIHEKKYTETGGAFMVMSLIGGALVPIIMGRVSDLSGSMQLAFIVPAICFALITIYFIFEHRWEKAHPDQVQEH